MFHRVLCNLDAILIESPMISKKGLSVLMTKKMIGPPVFIPIFTVKRVDDFTFNSSMAVSAYNLNQIICSAWTFGCISGENNEPEHIIFVLNVPNVR